MCDQDTYEDAIAYQLKNKELSRRQFGALGLGAGLVAMLPPVANAAEVTESEVEIKTPDGSLVPVSTFMHIESSTGPRALNRFQQRNSARIFGGAIKIR